MKSKVSDFLPDQFQGTCPQVAKVPWVQVLNQPLTSYIFLLDEVMCGQCLAHAATAKPLQSCPTLCDPTDGSPPGSLVPRILQAGVLEWDAISFSNA